VNRQLNSTPPANKTIIAFLRHAFPTVTADVRFCLK